MLTPRMTNNKQTNETNLQIFDTFYLLPVSNLCILEGIKVIFFFLCWPQRGGPEAGKISCRLMIILEAVCQKCICSNSVTLCKIFPYLFSPNIWGTAAPTLGLFVLIQMYQWQFIVQIVKQCGKKYGPHMITYMVNIGIALSRYLYLL